MDVRKDKKIIALLPFKNEEWVLREYIHSIKQITDHIIAYDDRSIDQGSKLLKDAGATIIAEDLVVKSGWAEHTIRQLLLTEGRKQGGTHFICLDADEVFSDNFYKNAQDIIFSLKPGQSLWMDWVTLYKAPDHERIDGVYRKLNKNFIFCDDKKIDFSYAFLGVSRTPGDPMNRLTISREQGSVIHYQYLTIERSLMKRAWYMCSEHIQKVRTPVRINTTYEIQKDNPKTKTKKLTELEHFTMVSDNLLIYNKEDDWRFKAITSWFEEYGIEFFEPLDIWQNNYFKELFKKKLNREPKPKVLPYFIRRANDGKNKVIKITEILREFLGFIKK